MMLHAHRLFLPLGSAAAGFCDIEVCAESPFAGFMDEWQDDFKQAEHIVHEVAQVNKSAQPKRKWNAG